MSTFPFFFQILKAFASELSLFNKFNHICTITQLFFKNFFCKNILVAAPICEESNVLWYYFKRGETFHEANHWKGNINTDANPVPPRWIYCLQNFGLPWLCYFYAVLCSKKKKVFLNFNIIYKSYKCYSMTFTGEICTYQLGERSCCFSVYYIQLFHHDVTHHQYVNLSSIWKWNLCVLSYCILS